MSDELIRLLRELGFTEYEGKAYLALLEKSPLTGYAVSLNSGVPRSKIYEVLGTLTSRGDVLVSQEPTPLYIPLPPNELIANRKKRAEQLFHDAQTGLERYCGSSPNRDNIWNIAGSEAILSHIKKRIEHAKQRIMLEIWQEDAKELQNTLKKAADRGVKILIVAYGELDLPFAQVYRHDMDQQITQEYGGRWVVFSSDDREVVAGILSLGQESRAAWTMHPGLVMPITEVIIHDLYIMEMLSAFREQLEDRFGPDLSALRDRFKMGPQEKKKYLACLKETAE